eukprot:GHVQ01040751.1.p1 GENE.GHVQ01040751.1~~GHVQ01040751.1.p1  ORF type:complete len:170 (-),score=36.59 GHVQ01040751.1:415-924(-)
MKMRTKHKEQILELENTIAKTKSVEKEIVKLNEELKATDKEFRRNAEKAKSTAAAFKSNAEAILAAAEEDLTAATAAHQTQIALVQRLEADLQKNRSFQHKRIESMHNELKNTLERVWGSKKCFNEFLKSVQTVTERAATSMKEMSETAVDGIDTDTLMSELLETEEPN